jgi:hypothetical protein
MEALKIRKEKWQSSKNEMKNRKNNVEWSGDTKGMNRRNQVVITKH